jgi:hypothetical protein
MTAERAGNVQWKATTVLIRSDIFTRAEEEGINISGECNRALADRLGIDYSQQQIPEAPAVKPVIIASGPSDGISGPAGTGRRDPLRPVLDAEDPRAPAHVQKMRAEPLPASRKEPAAVPAQKERGEQETRTAGKDIEARRPAGKKGAKKGSQRKGREDVIRRFLEKKIIRTESAGDEVSRIAKDEMYQLFVRFCRADSAGGVPDKRSFTIALKNRFAMEDSTVNGTSCWAHVKLR